MNLVMGLISRSPSLGVWKKGSRSKNTSVVVLKWYRGRKAEQRSATLCSVDGASAFSGNCTFEPVRTLVGQLLDIRMSATLAPRSAWTSPSVWKGRYLSLDIPAAIPGSSKPPILTRRRPSEVFVIDLLPKKYRLWHTSSSELSNLSTICSGKAWFPTEKYVGKAMGIFPPISASISWSFSEDEAPGSANRSPKMRAKEKEFLECSLEILSKALTILPPTDPITILYEIQHFEKSFLIRKT